MPEKPQRKPISPRAVLLITLIVAVGLPGALFALILVLSAATKPAMIGALIRKFAEVDPATWPYTALVSWGSVVVLALILLTFGAVISGMTVWWEMRVSSRMQSRIGYNRAGAGGFLQWIADATISPARKLPRNAKSTAMTNSAPSSRLVLTVCRTRSTNSVRS